MILVFFFAPKLWLFEHRGPNFRKILRRIHDNKFDDELMIINSL